MGSSSDTDPILSGLARAQDAFKMISHGPVEFVEGISIDGDWEN